jgi:preprotein translocase subunit YajC
MSSWLFLLANDPPAQPPAPPMLAQFVPFLLILVVMWFLMIRPGMRQRREQQNMLTQLKKNDKIMTSAGIYGQIVAIQENDDVVTLKVDETTNSRIRISKRTIVQVLERDGQPLTQPGAPAAPTAPK